MGKNVADVLLSLNEADSEIAIIVNKQSELEELRDKEAQEIEEHKTRLAEYESLLETNSTQQQEDETRLKEEQAKIVERRKALSDLGGAKSAKLVEREIDIASRALQSLEERAIKSLDDVEVLEKEMALTKEAVSDLEQDFEAVNPKREDEISSLKKESSTLDKKRQKLLSNLEPRVRGLYERVTRRYSAGAVGIAMKQSCRSCYRSLPPQTYNQILAGNALIQCPGCSRILVYREAPEES